MTPRKILAIKLRAMGDTVLMTAPLAELRRAYPGAEIHVAVQSPWGPLLEGHPAVDRVWSYDRHSDRASRAKAVTRLAFKLRKEKFDCVVNFHASPSSATIAFATGARTRSIHFHGLKAKNRYSTVTVPGKGTLKPIIERDMDTVRALGIHAPAGRTPEIFLQAGEIKQAQEKIARLGLSGPILGIGIGASRLSKSWPLERFADLATEWSANESGSVLVFAGPKETDLAREYMAHLDRALAAFEADTERRAAIRSRIQVEADLPVRMLAAELSLISVFLGNDSGPRHLALAVGTPTVTLFGPEHPFEWHPYPEDRHPFFFIDQLPCRQDAAPGMPAWCGIDICIEEKHRCMTSIGVDRVTEALRGVARK